jgi:oligoribonuclease (3'-5' exoribonuclease)
MHYLWYDTETAGLDPAINPLLTAFFAICDSNLNVIDTLDLKLKPESLAGLTIDKGALEVNKIDIVKHLESPETLTYAQGAIKLAEFLKKHKIPGKQRSFTQAGHNLDFDKGFVYQYLFDRKEWEKLVHYRTLDTSAVTTFLKDVGILPDHLGNLSSLVNYFNIPMGEAHTAKDDVFMNIEVYKGVRMLMQRTKVNAINADQDLLSIVEM